MHYSHVAINSLAYRLAPVVVTSAELEEQLAPVFSRLRLPKGQLEALTGIRERRWWHPQTLLHQPAAAAARSALQRAHLQPQDLDILIYGAVCREDFEPATACSVAAELGIQGRAAVYDICNACLGVLNGMVDIANRIELGHIAHGMVVACESSRELVEKVIHNLNTEPSMAKLTPQVATLTGGSGAVAVILSRTDQAPEKAPQLLGGVERSAPEHNQLCRWGMEAVDDQHYVPRAATDGSGILRHGVALGAATWQDFLQKMDWQREDIQRIVCHQVGGSHQQAILDAIKMSPEKDFPTYPFLGNIGTVSLPLSAVLAAERGHIRPGHRVGLLGIGSGLNCTMLGVQW